MQLTPIATVRSPLTALEDAPRQGDEGAPEARVEVDPRYAEALRGLAVGERVVLLTWFHLADREVLSVHPRGDLSRAPAGVFATRSPDRPNPVGLHEVEVLGIDGNVLSVGGLEAIDGTPVVDIKPVLSTDVSAR